MGGEDLENLILEAHGAGPQRSGGTVDITKISDADIQNELERRRKVKAAEERARREAHAEHVVKNIGQFLPLVSQHSRTSCSDENLANAWDGRCTRCVLLEAQKYNNFNSDLKLVVDIHVERLEAIK